MAETGYGQDWWTGPVPLEAQDLGNGAVAWLFCDPHGTMTAAGSYFVAWRYDVAEWGSGEILCAPDDTWILPLEDAHQFGWMLDRLAGRAASYDPADQPDMDDPDAEWRLDWVGPDPLEEARYPLLGTQFEGHGAWESQGQGLLVGWLFYDLFGDIYDEGTFFVAVMPGVVEWGPGQIIEAQRDPGSLLLPVEEASVFGRSLAALVAQASLYSGHPLYE